MAIIEDDNISILRHPAAYFLFEYFVKEKNRYIHNKETERFLIAILETAKNRKYIFPKDSVFWRARLGCKPKFIELKNLKLHQKDIPYPPEEMKPLVCKANEGRANPKGISFLYLATSMQTAIQEVRPWLNTKISVATFRIKTKLTLVDCSRNIHKLDGKGCDNYETDFKKEKSLSECIECVWKDIDQAFSWPVDRADNNVDYVPTQILAEIFKNIGYAGIIYNSQFGEGKNVALFDLESAEQLDCKLYNVTKIPPFDLQEIC